MNSSSSTTENFETQAKDTLTKAKDSFMSLFKSKSQNMSASGGRRKKRRTRRRRHRGGNAPTMPTMPTGSVTPHTASKGVAGSAAPHTMKGGRRRRSHRR